jgi:glycosyltransferase involved in cell wall biosynthesis
MPTRVMVFQNRFRLGGQERQSALHLRTIDRDRYEPVVACLHREGEHLADLAALGIVPERFDPGRRLLRPGVLALAYRLARTIRNRNIALVHAQDFYTNVLGVMAARWARVPCIVTRVDLCHNVVGYRRALLRWASRGAARVVVNALAIRELCAEDGVDLRRVTVVRNGIDLEAFDAHARAEPVAPLPPEGPPTVTIVANMHHPVKGQPDLLVAMAQVVRRIPQARLFLVGDGERRPILEAQAAELGIGRSCHFLGHRLDVPAILGRSHVLVSASYAEGISNAVMEALAARIPVVGTRVGGTPELVQDDVNGFLVPPGSPGILAEKLMAILANRLLAREMGMAGRRLVEEEFAVGRMRQSFDQIYRELLAEPLRRAG